MGRTPGGTIAIRALLRAAPYVNELERPSELWKSFGIDEASLLDIEKRIPFDTFVRFWDALAERSGDRFVSLRAVRDIRPSVFGLIGQLVVNSRTVLEGGERYLRFQSLWSDGTLHEMARDDAFEIRFRYVDPRHASSMQVNHLMLPLIHRFIPGLGEHMDILAVGFMHPDPGVTKPYAKVYGSPVEFEAAYNYIRYPAEVADLELPRADRIVGRELTRTAEGLLARLEAREPLELDVRRAILRGIESGDTRIASVAAWLDLSPRSLQRRLKRAGKSYSEVLDDVRFDLAREYLQQGARSEEIAFALGFRDLSSFLKGFRRWTGTTPRDFASRTVH